MLIKGNNINTIEIYPKDSISIFTGGECENIKINQYQLDDGNEVTGGGVLCSSQCLPQCVLNALHPSNRASV